MVNNLKGLSGDEVNSLRKKYGKNIFRYKKEYRLLRMGWNIVSEPMFVLLVVACGLYFILNETGEGILMAVAMIIVSGISLYQEVKSSRAMQALKQLTEPRVTVIRNGKEEPIISEDLVPGDIMLLEEGMKVPADAVLVEQNDLTVDESVITGESMPVGKDISANDNSLYQGSMINSGMCVARVTATGNDTYLGRIGKSVSTYNFSKTLLQKQVNKFVKTLAIFGFIAFLLIFIINYLHYAEFATSLLFALTLAMSVIPEEIPVAFSSFMALGAYKVSRKNIIIRQPQIIESLGAINVLCLDKTGTITENRMQVKTLFSYRDDATIDLRDNSPVTANYERLLFYGVLASESNPFDSMEKAIWEAYRALSPNIDHEKLKMIHEYRLEGQPPMMTHVYQQGDSIIVAGKGAAERIIRVCKLPPIDQSKIIQEANEMAKKGYRVLGVASSTHGKTDMPDSQDDFNWQFEGLMALYDPPKKDIDVVIRRIYDFNVDVKLLTGDYPETATAIASQAGIRNPMHYCTGSELMDLSEEDLRIKIKDTHVFVRMYPDAKLRMVNALQANGEVVAMTGDGVNDGPALKAADIGIAMGDKGTQIARQAADIILTDDDLTKIPVAVIEGRKIYNNLVKAIRYIIAIHIPIILTASVPVILGWKYPNIFTPIHVIFLELIMGPTCSIFFEREPVEENNVLRSPRNRNAGLFARGDLLISILQGVLIAAGVLTLYHIYMNSGHTVQETRSIVFTTLIISNVFLTFTGRSFTKTINHTIKYKNSLAPWVIIISFVFLALIHVIPEIRSLFALAPLTITDFSLCTAVALASVIWFEIYKITLPGFKTAVPAS